MKDDDEQIIDKEKDNPYLGRQDFTDPSLRVLDKLGFLSGAVFILSFVVLLMFGYMTYQGVYYLPETHVVEVDELGRAFYAGIAGALSEKDIDKYVPQQISGFIDSWRSVTPDNVKKKKEVRDLLCMVSAGSDAKKRISEYITAKDGNPFQLGETLTRSVQVKTVLKSGDSSWIVDWAEETRTHSGEVVGEIKYYKANIITERRDVGEGCRQANPFGVSALTLSWSVVK